MWGRPLRPESVATVVAPGPSDRAFAMASELPLSFRTAFGENSWWINQPDDEIEDDRSTLRLRDYEDDFSDDTNNYVDALSNLESDDDDEYEPDDNNYVDAWSLPGMPPRFLYIHVPCRP